MFKVNSKSLIANCEIVSKLTTKPLDIERELGIHNFQYTSCVQAQEDRFKSLIFVNIRFVLVFVLLDLCIFLTTEKPV